MTRMVRAAVLTNYFEVAQHLGLNPLTLIAEAGLNRIAGAGPAFARNPETRLGDPSIRNIAVFRDGRLEYALRPLSALPPSRC